MKTSIGMEQNHNGREAKLITTEWEKVEGGKRGSELETRLFRKTRVNKGSG